MSKDEALRLVQVRPHDPLAWLALARAVQAEGNVQAARDCYERALSIDPLLHEAHVALNALGDGLSNVHLVAVEKAGAKVERTEPHLSQVSQAQQTKSERKNANSSSTVSPPSTASWRCPNCGGLNASSRSNCIYCQAAPTVLQSVAPQALTSTSASPINRRPGTVQSHQAGIGFGLLVLLAIAVFYVMLYAYTGTLQEPNRSIVEAFWFTVVPHTIGSLSAWIIMAAIPAVIIAGIQTRFTHQRMRTVFYIWLVVWLVLCGILTNMGNSYEAATSAPASDALISNWQTATVRASVTPRQLRLTPTPRLDSSDEWGGPFRPHPMFATSTPIPRIPGAVVVVEALNIRDGPGVTHAAVGRVQKDDELYIVASNEDETWVAIRLEDDSCGWVSASTSYIRQVSIEVTNPEFMQGWDRVRHNCRIPQVPTSTSVPTVRPTTGILKWYASGSGEGELNIENRSGQDGVVLVTALNGTRLVSAFVRTSSKFVIQGIPDGVYEVSILTGEQWNDQLKRFTQEVRYQRFIDTFDYITTATEYRIWSITFHPVVGGDGRTEDLPLESIPDLR